MPHLSGDRKSKDEAGQMALKDASRETRLQWFARQVIGQSWQGLDVDGGDIQSWAEAAGLIHEKIVTADDIAAREREEGILCGMECGGDLDVGDTYYLFSDDIATEAVKWDEIKPA